MIRIYLKKNLKTAVGDMALDIDIRLNSGEFVSLFGESGAGKTTILRMVAGLTLADEGIVQIGDAVWFDSSKKVNLPAQKRRIGFVFQDYALFPHLTVRENLEFALEGKREKQIIEELLNIVGLKELVGQFPQQLSGGQKQRVALARALVRKPQVLLLDEPLSALNLEWRMKLQDEILKIYQEYKPTTILVSHDFPEVFKLSHRVFLLENGKIRKSGLPQEVLGNDYLSSKFRVTGTLIEMARDGVVNILTVQVGQEVIKVVATDEEAGNLKVGDRIIVASKAFNPLIIKLNA